MTEFDNRGADDGPEYDDATMREWAHEAELGHAQDVWERGYRPGESIRGTDEHAADGIGSGDRKIMHFRCASCGAKLGTLVEHRAGEWLTSTAHGGQVRGLAIEDCPTHGPMLTPTAAQVRVKARSGEGSVPTYRVAPRPTKLIADTDRA